MRAGVNPTKGGKLIDREECYHRIIIPVHIPNGEGYFKDAYAIFELCLFSVIKTSVSKVKISVISNKCSDEINAKLLKLYNEKYINELIIEKEGIGKINSILKAVRTVEERLITISDADVLFLNGWEESVVEIFKSFSKAGAVCPVPVYRKHLDLTGNIWFDNFFSNKLKFRPVKNPVALEIFAKSVGWEWLEKEWKDVIGTIKAKDNTIAVLGCSHFVATYKKEIFEELPKENSIYLVDGDSEFLYTDEPVLKMGGYRLATNDNFAFHLGNVFEDWMQKEFSNIKTVEKRIINYTGLQKLKKSHFKYFMTEKVFKRIFKNNFILRKVLKYKGLTNEQVYNFLDKDYI
jgi:hypothetical protein